jgi:hypothetical protein
VTELLEHDPPRPSVRSWLVVGVFVLALVAAGVDDRHAHAAESARVDRCAAATVAARTLADRRVRSMASYVRPALNGAYTPEVRAGLSGLVGRAARQSSPALDAARTTCARVGVRPWHGDLRGRLAACRAAVDARLRWLAEVADDGVQAFRAVPDGTATTSCAA